MSTWGGTKAGQVQGACSHRAEEYFSVGVITDE
jgi:hypothetical protein